MISRLCDECLNMNIETNTETHSEVADEVQEGNLKISDLGDGMFHRKKILYNKLQSV